MPQQGQQRQFLEPDRESPVWKGIRAMIEAHFQEFRPNQYRQFQSSGYLNTHLDNLADQWWNLVGNRPPGMYLHEAEEIAYSQLMPISEQQEAEQEAEAKEPDPIEEWLESKLNESPDPDEEDEPSPPPNL